MRYFLPTRILSIALGCAMLAGCGVFDIQLTYHPIGGPPTATATATPFALELPPAWTDTPASPIPTAAPDETVPPISTLESGVPVLLEHMRMLDALHGWGLSGGRLLRTSDSGRIWMDMTPKAAAAAGRTIAAFEALDDLHAWAAVRFDPPDAIAESTDAVFLTSDGGQTWQAGGLPLDMARVDPQGLGQPVFEPSSIQFENTTHGWLLVRLSDFAREPSGWELFSTQDGGRNWSLAGDSGRLTSASIAGIRPCTPTAIRFSNANTGWLAGTCVESVVVKPMSDLPTLWSAIQTVDGGATWRSNPLPMPSEVAALAQNLPDERVYCGVEMAETRGDGSLTLTIGCRPRNSGIAPFRYAYHSRDNGQTWAFWAESGTADFPEPGRGWRFVPKSGAFLGGVYQTSDGGGTWEKMFSAAWDEAVLSCIDMEVCWAIVTLGGRTSLLHTASSGRAWEDIKPTAQGAPALCASGALSQLAHAPTGNKRTEKYALALSPAWQVLATAQGNNVRLWTIGGLLPGPLLEGHAGKVISTAISPDGGTFASGAADGTIRIWRTDTGGWQRTLDSGGSAVASLAFSPDGRWLAGGSWDYSIRLWRVADGALLSAQKVQHGWIQSVAFSPSGDTLAAASADNSILLLDVSAAGLASRRRLQAHTGSVESVAFSPDGALLASASSDTTVRIWRVSDGTTARKLSGFPAPLTGVAFSPDGKLLLVSAQNGLVQLWRAADGAHLCTPSEMAPAGTAAWIPDHAFAPDGMRTAWGTSDGTVWVWGDPASAPRMSNPAAMLAPSDASGYLEAECRLGLE